MNRKPIYINIHMIRARIRFVNAAFVNRRTVRRGLSLFSQGQKVSFVRVMYAKCPKTNNGKGGGMCVWVGDRMGNVLSVCDSLERYYLLLGRGRSIDLSRW